MPRYFIDTDDDDMPVVDELGQELSNDAAARNLALASLPDMLSAKLPACDRRSFRASVRDERGAVLYRATLSLDGEWLGEARSATAEPEPGAAAAEPSPRE